MEKRYETGSEEYEQALVDLDQLLARFDVIQVTRSIGMDAADIIAGLRTAGTPFHDLHDVYIAATARSRELPVLTANVDHFDRIEDLRVLDWAAF